MKTFSLYFYHFTKCRKDKFIYFSRVKVHNFLAGDCIFKIKKLSLIQKIRLKKI